MHRFPRSHSYAFAFDNTYTGAYCPAGRHTDSYSNSHSYSFADSANLNG